MTLLIVSIIDSIDSGQLSYLSFVTRVSSGQSQFITFKLAVLQIPLSLVVIVFNTGPFWISVLGWMINSERIVPVELLGMVLCFIGVVVISYS